MDFRSPISTLVPGARGTVLRVLAATTVPLTGNKIAELGGEAVSQSGVSNAIAPLVQSGLVLCERAGSANLYTLNRDHVAASAVLAAVGARDALIARMAAATQSWCIKPVAVWMFGSAARGQATSTSDVDVLVIRADAVSEDDARWEAQTLALSESVLRWSGNTCQVLEYSEAEFATLVAVGDRLVGALRDDAIVIAGRSPRQMTKAAA